MFLCLIVLPCPSLWSSPDLLENLPLLCTYPTQSALGALIVLYEQKIFTMQGVVWTLNSFRGIYIVDSFFTDF
ncbi:hypothetical protein EDB19DRAFT_1720388 [Suillus lakei]|nr:hypothetical protein EDB19DRAFT_1720388 [Suillus lakei]